MARLVTKIALVGIFLGLGACYVKADTAAGVGSEECRTVEVRNGRELEACRTRCTDDGCRTHCTERERYAREHRCWVD